MNANQLQRLVARFASGEIDLGEFQAEFAADYLGVEHQPIVEQLVRIVAGAVADYEVDLLSEAQLRVRLSEEILPSSSPYFRLIGMQGVVTTSFSALKLRLV